MGGLKSAWKSVKRFVKKNTRDIATVIGFAIGGPAGAAIGQGIGSLGEGRDFKKSVMSAGKVYAGASMAQGAGLQGGQDGFGIKFGDPITGSGGIGGFFEDVGASGRDMFSGKNAKKFGSGDLMGTFDDLNMLQKAGVLGIGTAALTRGMGEEEPATMSGPIDQSGYLTQGLTPAQLSNVYNTQGSSTGIAGSMPSLAQNYDYDPVNSTIAELLRKQDEYELAFPEFARVNVKDGGQIARLQDGGELPEIDLRENGGDIEDPEGSGDEDTVPALLADGEFVMTKQAVKGIGNGNHDAGIAQLYAMMETNENKAQSMGLGRA
mgnify:CR=1 FL=1